MNQLYRKAIFAILTLTTCTISCLDYTPVGDVSKADAGVSPDVAANACYQCSAGVTGTPVCGDQYAACMGTPKCLALFLCGIPHDCYAPGKDLVSCLTACGLIAGLSSADDPAVTPFLALYGCATTSCAGPCASGTDGGAADGDASEASAACAPPQGATCPPTSGNCKGIGKPCTKGGGECASDGKQCGVDLDPTGKNFCISILSCTPGSCGTGATCCKTPMTMGVPVCLPDQCLPSDCPADP